MITFEEAIAKISNETGLSLRDLLELAAKSRENNEMTKEPSEDELEAMYHQQDVEEKQ